MGSISLLRRLIPMIALVVVLAAAAVLWHDLPTPTAVYAPFDVRGSMGAAVTGRGVSATVTRVRIADRLGNAAGRDRSPVTATGRWVVVDAVLMATTTPDRPHVELLVGPNTYSPADRFDSAIAVGELAPGIAVTAPWVFEVAPTVLDAASDGQATLHVWVGDGRLDSRLVITVPLAGPGASRSDVATLQPVTAAAS